MKSFKFYLNISVINFNIKNKKVMLWILCFGGYCATKGGTLWKRGISYANVNYMLDIFTYKLCHVSCECEECAPETWAHAHHSESRPQKQLQNIHIIVFPFRGLWERTEVNDIFLYIQFILTFIRW